MSDAMIDQVTAEGSTLRTRRDFARLFAAAGAALAIAPWKIMLAETTASRGRHAVVAFHMDQLYVDYSGTAIPYQPPLGARSGQAAADLSEEDFRRRFVYA